MVFAVKGLQEQQSQWTIPDTVLRSNMKDAIAEDFLPSYNVRAVACACRIVHANSRTCIYWAVMQNVDYWVVKAVIILHHEQGSRGHLLAASSAVNDSSGSLTPTIIFCEATVSSDVLVNVKCCMHLVLQEFLDAYKGVDFTKSPEKYFKYSVKDIQAMLLETFAR